jgi:hypothetical protein
MSNLVRVSSWRLGIVSLMALVAVCASSHSVALAANAIALPCRDGGNGCLHIGFTDAWFDGNVVQLEYSHPFFCAQGQDDNGDSACNAGSPATAGGGILCSRNLIAVPNRPHRGKDCSVR